MPIYNDFSVRDLIRSVREGKYTSLGCYPKYWITRDYEALSYEAVRENIWQIARATRDHNDKQWEIIGVDVNWESRELYCAHTNERIESAYAEDTDTDSAENSSQG